MNRIRDINPKRLIVSGILLLTFSLALLLFARDVVREVFVIPISYIVWVAGVIASYTPQLYFWILLLVIFFMIAYRSLVGRRKVYAPPPSDLMELIYSRAANNGRVSFWQIKANLLNMGSPYYHASFHNTLGRLVIDLLAYRYRLTPAQVEARLEEGMLEVPADVREYVLRSLRRDIGDPRGYFARLRDTILETIRELLTFLGQGRSIPAQAQKAPTDPRVARILAYMKDELEVSHDNSGR